ncbi:MAG: hypothetical protein P4L51_06305 [Puia sp.]|nr:hypothetical protein [Puia sp.]
MKLLAYFAGLLLLSTTSLGQTNYSRIADSIHTEGLKLYFSEKASWEGSDLFFAEYPLLKSHYGGYFSYTVGDTTRCVILTNDTPTRRLVIFYFPNGKSQPTSEDAHATDLNPQEREYLALKKTAIDWVRQDTFFRSYLRTTLNFVPLIDGQGKRVYLLTGPQDNGIMLLGNDYLMRYSADDSLLSKSCLHRNIISIPLKKDSTEESAFHTHFPPTSEYLTATDYCTLRLYAKYTSWKQHYVITKDAVSILNFADGGLLILSKKAYDRIAGDKGRH